MLFNTLLNIKPDNAERIRRRRKKERVTFMTIFAADHLSGY